MKMSPTPEELQRIRTEWMNFAQKKVFAFRGITAAAYALYAPEYFRSVMDRSTVRVFRSYDGDMTAAIVYEPSEDSVTVHWAWTHFEERNQGQQYLLWERCGITKDSNVFITHLTVLSEKLAEKYGWLYSPFALYKGITNAEDEARRHVLGSQTTQELAAG